MKISEFKTDEGMIGSVDRLEKLYNNAGNCVMDGFLGDSVDSCNFDENGILEFSSRKEKDGVIVQSVGAVLSDSILIKQNQEGEMSEFHNLYSWNKSGDSYTYLCFDDESVLNRYYGVMKRFDVDLCSEDISTAFKRMGLSFDNVTQVLLNQKVDPVQRMFDEEMNSEEKVDSFVL